MSLCVALASPARGEVTAEQVNEAIRKGVEWLESQQHNDGHWTEYEGEPGGLTALCTLALLNCGRTTEDTSVDKALNYLQRIERVDKTYSASLMIMAFVQADPARYATRIESLATGRPEKSSSALRGDVANDAGRRTPSAGPLAWTSSTRASRRRHRSRR